MFKGKFDHRDLTLVVDTGATGVIDTTGDIAIADVRDLERVSVVVNQITDLGTATLSVEKTMDGTNWIVLATLTDASFVAGANKGKETTLSDASGMALRCVAVRVVATAIAGGGVYTATVAGQNVGHTT